VRDPTYYSFIVGRLKQLLKICSENPGHKVSKNKAIPGDCVLLYVDPQVSQPPLLSMMVCAIHLEAANLTLVEQALPILRKEHNFWTTGVILSDACNCYQHSILLIFENEINSGLVICINRLMPGLITLKFY
jgi:hypothetical protein